MAKNKMEDVYNDMLSPVKSRPQETRPEVQETRESFIRVNFFISNEQKKKLENYTQQISLEHIRVSQSEVIRYMIENFNIDKAKQEFFKHKL